MDCSGLSHGVSFWRILDAVERSGRSGVLRIRGDEGTGRILFHSGEIRAVYIEVAPGPDEKRAASALIWRSREDNHDALSRLRKWGVIEYRFHPEVARDAAQTGRADDDDYSIANPS